MKTKNIKRIAAAAAGLLIFCMIVYIMNYIYASVSDVSRWHRIMWHNFYEDKGKIDNLYLGSSHVYNDINPFELDKLNGKYNFNLSAQLQLMNGTYYLLREADKYNDLQHVYVELYYFLHSKDNFNDNGDLIKTGESKNWDNTDNMKLSLNKLEYIFTMADIEKYPDIFFRFSRYRVNLDDWDTIKSTLQEKRSGDYINFEYSSDSSECRTKGYWYSEEEYQKSDRIFAQNRILGENPISETSEEYLRKVITYCQKRNIPITLFVSPMYELQLISTENYDNYLNQVMKIAAEYNVDIYDFNLAKEEYLPIQDTKYFRNIGHLNYLGADMYTSFFHKVVTGGREEKKKYFYESYAQKLANTAPEVYGIYYRSDKSADDGKALRNMFMASNRENGIEYRIIMMPDNGREQYMVQDFDENGTFKIDANEHGICTVVYRMKDTPDKVETLEIKY